MYKTQITDLDELKQHLRTEWDKLDHVVIVAAIHQWHRQWVQITDVCFVIFLAVFPTRCNQLDSNLAILETTVKIG